MISKLFRQIVFGAFDTFDWFKGKAGIIGVILYFLCLIFFLPISILVFAVVGLSLARTLDNELLDYSRFYYEHPLVRKGKTFKEHLIHNFKWSEKSFEPKDGYATVDLHTDKSTVIIRPFKRSKYGCIIPFPEALKGIASIQIPSYLWMEELTSYFTNFDYWSRQFNDENPPSYKLSKDDWFKIKECKGKRTEDESFPYIALEDESGEVWKFNHVIFAFASDIRIKYRDLDDKDVARMSQILVESARENKALKERMLEFEKLDRS